LPGLQVATQDSTAHALVDARRERGCIVPVMHVRNTKKLSV